MIDCAVRAKKPAHLIYISIVGIDRAGPAARAGLKAGDVVTSVDGNRVDTSRGLTRAVAATAPGGAVKLAVRRGTQTLEVPVTVGRRPADPPS